MSAADLALMRRIDELHLEHPFMGARMLRDQLNRLGVAVGRKHVGSLMARMGIVALYRKPGTSKKHPGHKVRDRRKDIRGRNQDQRRNRLRIVLPEQSIR